MKIHHFFHYFEQFAVKSKGFYFPTFIHVSYTLIGKTFPLFMFIQRVKHTYFK